MSISLCVVDDPAARCAALLHEAARAGGDIVVTGGSTPAEAYRVAAGLGGDWSRAAIWFSDERCVPGDDERSNFLLASRSLVAGLPEGRGPAAVHRMPGELGWAEGADAYERELLEAGPPRFSLVLLGLGPDAHIASLFPRQPSLEERSRLAVGVPEAGLQPYVPRISLTLPALTASEEIVFLVTGESKAAAVAVAFGDGAVPDVAVPASLLAEMHDRITVLLDAPAAARL